MTTVDNSTAAETTVESTAAIDTYLAAWSETDPAQRMTLLNRAVAPDLWYRDGQLEADGAEAFSTVLGTVQELFPGHIMSRTSRIDSHHDLARFTWALGTPGEPPVISGVDVVKFDDGGRLHRIIGFTPEDIPT